MVLSRVRDRVSLCINSFLDARGGLTPADRRRRRGTRPTYENVDVKGAVVLGDAEVLAAVAAGGEGSRRAGVISTGVAPYIRASDPEAVYLGRPARRVSVGSGSVDADAKAFGFKASWRAASRMRARLKAGPVQVKVEIQSTFYDGPNRSLIAEIPGSVKPDERIVAVAHVQEPGANDNASGTGTLWVLAAGLADAVRTGALTAPGRTLTFIWTDEIRGSRQWLSAYPEQAKAVQYMFSLDMTGEDTSKTGGTFLIEKQADPTAVWSRPSDPHTEWGAGDVKANTLKGSLLNDLHLAVCLRQAKDTKWVVRTNPYEGGSDHTVFAEAGVPSLLNWHFTDRFYHTNLDRPIRRARSQSTTLALAVATSMWFLAFADEPATPRASSISCRPQQACDWHSSRSRERR